MKKEFDTRALKTHAKLARHRNIRKALEAFNFVKGAIENGCVSNFRVEDPVFTFTPPKSVVLVQFRVFDGLDRLWR